MNKIMTDSRDTAEIARRSMARRNRKEKMFRAMGVAALLIGLSFLLFLFSTIVSRGYGAFVQTQIQLPLILDESLIDPRGQRDPADIARGDYQAVIRNALRRQFPDVSGRSDRRALNGLVSNGASYKLRTEVRSNPDLIGKTFERWLLADDEVDMLLKG
ncbi:MAG: DUF3333 domain-containing protein, partial [Gammaproteobacteria bacterium]|nr:DUF3333 domain-containing protein [Gammaproteobacteria bacterium]